jgi:hypothetical protein
MLTTIFAAQEGKPLPRVVSAQAPFYPRVLQVAHYEGIVRLRVTTDGKRASSIETLSGQPMLARAATENVPTWEFEQHRSTTFETTFRFRLLETECGKSCKCKTVEAPAVVLRLPAEIDISAEEVHTCDPVTTIGE